jgi:prepilin-type N-terminal cleavage/methylation domain-containing protein
VRKQRGFTIVELLIVIVVIGILAAITIVAYNGIQQRARNAKTVSAAQAYLTAFQGYLAQNGSLPFAGYGGDWCLGQAAISCTAATSTWSRSAPLESALQTVITQMPLPSDGPGTASTYDPNMGYITSRTPTDDPQLNGVNSAFLIYILEGDTSCPVGPVASGIWPDFSTMAPIGGRTYYLSGVSTCWVPLPAS